jgi:hypothetical protein
MSFKATYDTAVDSTHVFRKQLAGTLHAIAIEIVGEDVDGPQLDWARRVVIDPVPEAAKWVWLMLTNATFAADPSNCDDGAMVTIAKSFLPTMIKI